MDESKIRRIQEKERLVFYDLAKNLTSELQFLDLLKTQTMFAVFKHSTRCSISAVVKNRIERDWNLEIPIYYQVLN